MATRRRSVFFSFHFDNDVFRVQQVRNMGVLEGNEPVSPSAWEEVKRKGNASIERWIDDNMKYRQCVVVLVGAETASRHWVQYEIAKAWEDSKGLFGIYIHNLKCPVNGTCRKGPNPFDEFAFQDGRKLSSVINCYDPNTVYAYTDIQANMEHWVEQAITEAQQR